MPMTSPVDFISGPSTISTPEKRENGKTDSLTEKCGRESKAGRLKSFNFLPAITWAATLAKGEPVALLTNGAVRDARGLTSRT